MPSDGYQLTVLEAFAICYAAGWRFLNLVRAVAVMSAESARFDRAWHLNDNGTVDRGLFQINSLHDQATSTLFDQMKNAKFAYGLWQQRKWTAWAAWNHGKAQVFVPELRRYLLTPWRYKRLIPDIPFGP